MYVATMNRVFLLTSALYQCPSDDPCSDVCWMFPVAFLPVALLIPEGRLWFLRVPALSGVPGSGWFLVLSGAFRILSCFGFRSRSS